MNSCSLLLCLCLSWCLLSLCVFLLCATAVLGKRIRSGEDGGGSKRKKVFVPVSEFADVNFTELLNERTLSGLENTTGARLMLRGRGSQQDASGAGGEDNEELHVLVQTDNDDALEAAASKVHDFLFNPVVREQQLVVLNQSTVVSALSRDREKANPHTFSLSNALYANDEGYTMMGSRPQQPSGGGDLGGHRGGGGGGRRDETSKEIEIPADKGQHAHKYAQSESHTHDRLTNQHATRLTLFLIVCLRSPLCLRRQLAA